MAKRTYDQLLASEAIALANVQAAEQRLKRARVALEEHPDHARRLVQAALPDFLHDELHDLRTLELRVGDNWWHVRLVFDVPPYEVWTYYDERGQDPSETVHFALDTPGDCGPQDWAEALARNHGNRRRALVVPVFAARLSSPPQAMLAQGMDVLTDALGGAPVDLDTVLRDAYDVARAQEAVAEGRVTAPEVLHHLRRLGLDKEKDALAEIMAVRRELPRSKAEGQAWKKLACGAAAKRARQGH